jgi:class 3 adenylate cyclase/tetratricopeptide (TPR) repeat protein
MTWTDGSRRLYAAKRPVPRLGAVSAPSRTCGTCGAGNPDAARFCARCGARLVPSCEHCGADLPDAARFCSSCGRPVAEALPAGQERKLVTVLFADVVGSTGLGEVLDPERLKEVMDAYFEAMRREIEAEGGTVEKFIGDAVVAVFGVPTAHEDDARRAVRAVLRMRAALDRLNQDLEPAHGLLLSMRIGVNTGEVVATPAPRPGEGMVAGDVVNVAARLEQSAEPGQVLVGERTARSARGFRLQEVGSLALKGKELGVKAYELLEQARVPTPGGRSEGARSHLAPMVGRLRELVLLQSLYERATAEGSPHLVTVYGEAGMGKSRLVEEFEAWATVAMDPPVLATGRCLPYGEGVTYWPLAEMLKSRAGVLDSDAPDVALARVREVAGKVLLELLGDPEEADRAAAVLGASVGLRPAADGPDETRAEDPHRTRSLIHEVWRSWFSALARSGPVLAVVEDIHWADPALLDLLEDLAARVDGAVLFLCPARPELTSRRPGWGGGRWNFSALRLDPLASTDAEELVDHLLGDEEIPARLRARILERAGGNPFYLEEIVRHVLEERQAVALDEGWRAAAEIEDVDIPDTVQGVLAARIDLLPPPEKRALQSAAVVGRAFWSGPVERLLRSEGGGDVAALLASLETRGLVSARLVTTMEGDREYAFHHILTRDVAYESIPRRRRASAHAEVASWIEEVAGERSREFAELLAHHFGEAHRGSSADRSANPETLERLRERAFRYSLMASVEARHKVALDQAERHAETAVAVASGPHERSRALEALGLAYFHASEGDLAWQCLKEAVDLRVEAARGGAPIAPAEVAALCATALEVPTRGRGVMRARLVEGDLRPYLELGSGYSGTEATEAGVRLDIVRAHWPWSFRDAAPGQRELADARDAGMRAYEQAVRLDRPDLASAALDGVSTYYLGDARYEEMESVADRRLGLVASLDSALEIGDAYAVAAWRAWHLGRYRQAFELADRGFRLAGVGSEMIAIYCLDWRAKARFRLGDWDGVLEDAALVEQMLGERRETPPGLAADHVAVAALVHELRGDEVAANRLLEVVAWLERNEQRPSPIRAACRVRILARRGDHPGARKELELADDPQVRHGRDAILEAWTDLVAEEGAWDEAHVAAEAAREWAGGEGRGLLALPLYADRVEGRAAVARGDPQRGRDLLERAAVGFDGLEAEWEAAVTRLDLAGADVLLGRRDQARATASSALEVFERLDSLRERDRARRVLDDA